MHNEALRRDFKDVNDFFRTIKSRSIASERGKELYDGDRANGYGGYINDGRWEPVAQRIIRDIFNISSYFYFMIC